MSVDESWRRHQQHSPDLTIMLYQLAEQVQAKTIMECGVGEGISTCTLLIYAIKNKAHLWSVDIHPCEVAHQRVWGYGLMDAEENKALWTLTQRNDVDYAREWQHGKIDLVFIDTSHYYAHTVEELKVWTPHVAEDGIIVLHDTKLEMDSGRREVFEAIEAFLLTHKEWMFQELTEGGTKLPGLGVLKHA